MAYSIFDPYGSFLPSLWYHGLRERLHGNASSANARWGGVRLPPTTGKVIWVLTGKSRESVRLGVELLRAIREKRLDVRLVLTFEAEFPELLTNLENLKKTGHGYGPCDHPFAVKRILGRFSPFGVIFAGITPRKNLMQALESCTHKLVVAAEAPAEPVSFEQIFPASEYQSNSWKTQPQAPIVDFQALITEAQVDPNFVSLVNDGADRHLWWLHSDDIEFVTAFFGRFRAQFPDAILFVSGIAAQAEQNTESSQRLKISHWQRTKIGSGTMVMVDEQKWLPAISAAVSAVHLQGMALSVLWQAMAGGCAVSCEDNTFLPKSDMAQSVSMIAETGAILHRWKEYCENPILARGRSDLARKWFWQERRLAAEVNEALLQRIFEW
ncbi:hypothetical protein [Sulfurirhabdus autotrophica]|uniref:Uncharacterized protein n=1 Tax=Sulfurirhabdus autotrophica TaxID=1706046 RepID=A0A4R3Y5C0_9PROT|nr:hypothetical protein [Sulfurirhabdus autotrophica]TCV85353.1 hypothetical protein EDC63_10924 [Sulfurirhabdus autotrophica]